MFIKINFDNPVFQRELVPDIRPADLEGFYLSASDSDKSNLFFVLLNSAHHYESNGDNSLAAHLNFLIAYYLFIVLTPPGSVELALHYIKKAISMNHLAEYDQWLALIEKGN